jgi:DNA-binding MarR family transcriptional regulator
VSEGPATNRTSVRALLSVGLFTWRRHLQRHLVPFGITLKQLHVLRRLARHEYLYPSKIAEMLFCDRPTATVIIRNMEKQGWVTRQRDAQDRRQVRVIITERGKDKLAEIAPSWRDLERQFDPLGCFSEHEVAELARLLTKLNVHLKQLVGDDASREKESESTEG